MRYTKGMMALLLAAFAGAPVLGAQETPPRAREPLRGFVWSTNRARIGVVVNTRADSLTDRFGARIEAVTPGGPADRAGLVAGDIITRFNSTSLAGLRTEQQDESGPGNKLVELARALEPGDTVRLEYRRGDATRRVTLVASDLGWSVTGRPEIAVMPRMPDFPRFDAPEIDVVVGRIGSLWHGVELVSLDEELGEYFGVTEGVLVVKAGGDSALPLRGGDVILSIGGRKPTSPSHALRILRSYDEGETVSIEVQRKQRRQTISWTVPESRMRLRGTTPRARPSRAPRPERTEET